MRKVKYQEMGKRLKEARIAAGYKQKDCLQPLGDITVQMLSDWENGYVCPSITYLKNLSKFYNISLDYIILGKAQNEKDLQIRTYKTAIEYMSELIVSKIFTIRTIPYKDGNKIYSTTLETTNKIINEYLESYFTIQDASKCMKPELVKQAFSDLLNKYDLNLEHEKDF